jgi:Cu2+-exporting ATPase
MSNIHNYKEYDVAEITSKYAKEDEGFLEVQLTCQSINCGGCVHSIESKISKVNGIEYIRANFTNKRVKILFDKNVIKLSSVMMELSDIGYESTPIELNQEETEADNTNTGLLYRMGLAGFAAMNMMWVSIALYSGANEGEYKNFFDIIGLVLATPTVLYSGSIFFRKAFSGLMRGIFNMDLPISIGIAMTYSYSIHIMVAGGGDPYFDTVINFIFVILIGRYIETKSKRTALYSSRELHQMQPKTATVVNDSGEIMKSTYLVNVGENIVVKAGESIPLDGCIINGNGSIDESIMTGESNPREKSVGDEVFAGTINTHGLITIEVKKDFNGSSVQEIIRMIDDVRAKKSKTVTIVEKIVPYFVMATLVIGIMTYLYWAPISTQIAILSAVSVFIITCPCALALATPMTIGISAGVAAKKNILIKDADGFENQSLCDIVVLDKTGTITTGKFQIKEIISEINSEEALDILVALESKSAHPIAKAICKEHKSSKIVDEFKMNDGLGISGVIDGVKWHIGSYNYISGEVDVNEDAITSKGVESEERGESVIWCSDEQNVKFIVIAEDTIKEDAREVIALMEKMNKRVIMLTGDNKYVANAVGEKVGIKTIISGATPKDKLEAISRLKKEANVLMVGDGINDSASLSMANSSISFSVASDITQRNADVIILNSKMMPIIESMILSANVRKKIKQNILFSLSYNVILVPMAAMGNITPLFAAIAMPISSILVIGNSSLLLRNKKK